MKRKTRATISMRLHRNSSKEFHDADSINRPAAGAYRTYVTVLVILQSRRVADVLWKCTEISQTPIEPGIFYEPRFNCCCYYWSQSLPRQLAVVDPSAWRPSASSSSDKYWGSREQPNCLRSSSESGNVRCTDKHRVNGHSCLTAQYSQERKLCPCWSHPAWR